MEMRAPVFALLLALLLGCAASEAARTELIVVIDSDLNVPDELDQLSVHAEGPGQSSQTASASLGPGQPPLPRTLALQHVGGPLGPIAIQIEGKVAGRRVLLREAEVSFVAGRSLVLPLHLARSCLSRVCEMGETCTERGCRDVAIDESSLNNFTGEPATLVARDAGASDDDARAKPHNDAGVAPELEAGEVNAPELDAGELDASAPDAARGPGADGGDANLMRDAAAQDAAADDSGQCVPRAELCNQIDDDCDGRIDNGFNLSTDVNNCGRCGTQCNQRRSEVCCRGVCSRTCS